MGEEKISTVQCAVAPVSAETTIAMKKADLEDPSQDDLQLVSIVQPVMERDARRSSLRNTERTCWMNTLLHAMSAIPPLAHWLLSHKHMVMLLCVLFAPYDPM